MSNADRKSVYRQACRLVRRPKWRRYVREHHHWGTVTTGPGVGFAGVSIDYSEPLAPAFGSSKPIDPCFQVITGTFFVYKIDYC